VNVFGYQTKGIEIDVFKEHIYSLRISKQSERTKLADLLLISNEEGMQHYCVIKDLSRLLSSQISKDGHKQHFCQICLQAFTSEDSLKSHVVLCSSHEEVRITYPEKKNMMQVF